MEWALNGLRLSPFSCTVVARLMKNWVRNECEVGIRKICASPELLQILASLPVQAWKEPRERKETFAIFVLFQVSSSFAPPLPRKIQKALTGFCKGTRGLLSSSISLSPNCKSTSLRGDSAQNFSTLARSYRPESPLVETFSELVVSSSSYHEYAGIWYLVCREECDTDITQG